MKIKSINFLDLPLDVLSEIFSNLGLKDIAMIQSTNRLLYNYIMEDSQFMYYNTVKILDLYYKKKYLLEYLFIFVHPRYSLLMSQNDHIGNTPLHIIAENGLQTIFYNILDREKSGLLTSNFTLRFLFNREASKIIHIKKSNINCRLTDLQNQEPNNILGFISYFKNNLTISFARNLIRSGSAFDLWKIGRAGNTALCEAIQAGNIKMVQMIIKEAIILFKNTCQNTYQNTLAQFINKKNNYSENAIILASRTCPQILELLLKHGGDPNSDRNGFPLLTILASDYRLDRKNPQTFTMYHQHKTVDWNSSTSLMTRQKDVEYEKHKKKSNSIRVMKILLKNGANPFIIESSTGMTPLQMAAFWGDKSAINCLINFGKVDPNKDVNCKSGWLPIHYSCLEGQDSAIKCLIHNGAYIQKKNISLHLPEHLPEHVPSPFEVLPENKRKNIHNYLLSQKSKVYLVN